MNLFDTLMHPDRDEHPGRGLIAHAANLLQVGEFQFLQLAFLHWHDRELTEAEASRLFDSFMVANNVPGWATMYANRIIELDQQGQLDDRNPHYHQFDYDHPNHRRPNGTQRFVASVAVIAGILGGAIAFASNSADCGASQYPPCFSHAELGESDPVAVSKDYIR